MNEKIIAYMKKNEDIEGLIQLLNTRKSVFRMLVIQAMCDIHDDRITDALMDTLREDPDEEIRSACAEALGNIKDTRCITPLILSLRDSSGVVRSRSAEAIGRLKDPRGIKALILALSDENVGVRKIAASSLGLIKDPKAFEPLRNALTDPDKAVRSSAAGAIGRLGLTEGIDPLVNLLSESNPKVVRSALEGLGRIGGDRVIDILQSFISTSESSQLKYIAEDILTRIQHKGKKDKEENFVQTDESTGMSKQEILKYKEMLKRLNTLGN